MNRLILVFLIAMVAFSCKNSERAKRKPIEGRKAAYLLNQLKSNELDFKSLKTKAAFSMIQAGKKTNFKASIRMRKDSAIWLSITPALGIEMARVLITRDSVKVINRIKKEFFIGDFEYINQKFNVALDYDDIQAVMLGNSIAFEEDEKLKFRIDNEMYYLGNLKKRKARKAEEKPQKVERKKEEVISLWLDANNFKIRKFLLSDLTAERFIRGNYSNYLNLNDQLIPQTIKFDIQSKEPSELSIEYSKLSLEEKVSFPFNISSKYVQIHF